MSKQETFDISPLVKVDEKTVKVISTRVITVENNMTINDLKRDIESLDSHILKLKKQMKDQIDKCESQRRIFLDQRDKIEKKIEEAKSLGITMIEEKPKEVSSEKKTE